MKPLIPLLLLVLSAFSGTVSAQKPIILKEDSVNYGNSKYPGFSILIPEVNDERTKKEWIRELQSGTKSKVVTENSDMTIFGAIIKDISPNPLNIYSRIVKLDSATLLTASFELKKDVYIEKATGEPEVLAARLYLKQFAKNQYVDFVRDETQREEKILNNLKEDLNRLQNEKSRMQKSIQSNESLITEEKANIVKINTEMPGLDTEITNENNILISMEAGAAREEKAAYVKELEKRKKKMTNEISSSENKIKRAGDEIEEATNNIPKNEAEQDVLRIKIAQQETVYRKFENKLITVKAY